MKFVCKYEISILNIVMILNYIEDFDQEDRISDPGLKNFKKLKCVNFRPCFCSIIIA